LLRETVEGRFLTQLPDRIIGDETHDGDPWEAELAALDVRMITPHRRGRKKPKRRMDGQLDVIEDAGKWNVSLPGFRTSGVWASGGNTIFTTSWTSFISDASSSS
jgi:hypothetical protein